MFTYPTIAKERTAYVERTFLGSIERINTAHGLCIAIRDANRCARVQAIVWCESTFPFLSSNVSILRMQ
jgi:hypothetical protein